MTQNPPKPPTNLTPEMERYLFDLSKYLQEQFSARPILGQTVSAVYLYSPDQSAWECAVTNAGVFSSVKVQA